MKILALPSRLTLALELMLGLAAEPRVLRDGRDRRATKRRAALRAPPERNVAPRVPALHADLLHDDDLRLVAPARRHHAVPRFGRAWAVRAGTGHRAIGRASAPSLWL